MKTRKRPRWILVAKISAFLEHTYISRVFPIPCIPSSTKLYSEGYKYIFLRQQVQNLGHIKLNAFSATPQDVYVWSQPCIQNWNGSD